MTLDIKICGLKTEDALAAALSGGASHVGFIFFQKSRKCFKYQCALILKFLVNGFF